ncbi:MAG: hypothetical protein ACRDF4_07615 [Rhabdochlamydiaceae bacterium]
MVRRFIKNTLVQLTFSDAALASHGEGWRCKDFPFHALIHNKLEPPEKKTTLQERRTHTKNIVAELMCTETHYDGIKKMIGNDTKTLTKLTKENAKATEERNDEKENQQTNQEKLLALKDKLKITDSKWPEFVQFVDLGNKSSLHYIRKKRKEINTQAGVSTIHEHTSFIEFEDYLR